MTPDRELEVVNAEDDAGETLRKLLRQGVHQLPVVRHGHFEGMVRRSDILRWVERRSEFAH